jgi:hypothetical protein
MPLWCSGLFRYVAFSQCPNRTDWYGFDSPSRRFL